MYVFEFTSEYINKSVRSSDTDRELMKERKAAAVSVQMPDRMGELHELLLQHAEKHTKCIVGS